MRAELAVSRRKLAEALGRPPELFAYPFGGREHITPRSRELVREAGFVCCAGCHGGVNPVKPDSSPVTVLLPVVVDASGSLNGPKVRCGNGPRGQ